MKQSSTRVSEDTDGILAGLLFAFDGLLRAQRPAKGEGKASQRLSNIPLISCQYLLRKYVKPDRYWFKAKENPV